VDQQYFDDQIEELHHLIDLLYQKVPLGSAKAQPLLGAIADRLFRIKALEAAKNPATGTRSPTPILANLARFPEEDPHPILRLDLQVVILYANAASRTSTWDWWGCASGQRPSGDKSRFVPKKARAPR